MKELTKRRIPGDSLYNQIHIARAKNVKELEKEEKEIIESSILKRDLVNLFEGYRSSRWEGFGGGLVTMLFRNVGLTQEKVDIAKRTIRFIKDFEGTKEELIKKLQKEKIKNAEISRGFQKFHFNFFGRREIRNSHGEIINYEVRKGESRRESGLANVFHNAIDMINGRQLSSLNIKNTF